MNCEPLRGKREEAKHYTTGHASFDEGYFMGYEGAMEDIISAIDFYKRYRNERDKLRREEPSVFDKWLYSDEHMNYIDESDKREINIIYNDWILDYCFGDVIEDA